MKKSNIIFIIISVVVILAILLYALESTGHLLSRFYWGDRITVTIDCTANGVTVQPDHEQVKCTAEDDRQGSRPLFHAKQVFRQSKRIRHVHLYFSDRKIHRKSEVGTHKLVGNQQLQAKP